MSQAEIIKYAESKGADVKVRNFETDATYNTICVNLGKEAPKDSLGIEAWQHGIFIEELAGKWVIGFSQSAKTQPLEQLKLIQVLELWFAEPSDEVFKPYE